MPLHHLMQSTYSGITYLALPFVLARMGVKGIKAPKYRQRWGERLGRPGFAPLDKSVWTHAVSVGEAQAAMPLIRAMVTDYPHLKTVVTTTTPTGSALVEGKLGDQVLHAYLPFDMPGFVQRFLDHTKPCLAVIMETEIWPNVFARLASSNIPLILANARLSARSSRGYSRIKPFIGPVLNACSRILAQSDADAQRFLDLGVMADKVKVSGNLKFDITLPADQIKAGRELRTRLGANRPVWIAASTHAGEDEIMFRAHEALRRSMPKALLILVPRHPERFDAVADQSRRSGFLTSRHSEDANAGTWSALPDVYVGDSMGELMMYYAAADIAVVGGSFVPAGGHNVLEPAALGLPVLTGSHVHNFKHIVELLMRNNALTMISDHSRLSTSLASLLASPATMQDFGERARRTVQAHTGATRITRQAIADLLPEQEPH